MFSISLALLRNEVLAGVPDTASSVCVQSPQGFLIGFLVQEYTIKLN